MKVDDASSAIANLWLMLHELVDKEIKISHSSSRL